MQTFLPYADFGMSARSLSTGHLGLQRINVKQLLVTLGVPMDSSISAWPEHPAVKMWCGNEWALAEYGVCICREWIRRGYRDAMCTDFLGARKFLREHRARLPEWLGWDAFHISHQSNLVRKNRGYYRPLFPKVPDNLPYIWPCDELHAGLVMGLTTGVRCMNILH